MSSWCAWPHMRIDDELDQRRPLAGARALGGPGERRGDRLGIGAVDRDAGDAVAGRLVREHAHRRLLGDRRRERRLVVLRRRRSPAAGARAQRLIASCHSPSDEPPSPMNETATRPVPSRQNAMRHAGDGRAIRSTAAPAAGSTPQPKSPTCRSLPSIGGPALPICALSTMPTTRLVVAGRIASATPEVADHRRDDVAVPRAVGAAKRRRRGAGGSRRRRSLPGRAIGSPCPGTRVSP